MAKRLSPGATIAGEKLVSRVLRPYLRIPFSLYGKLGFSTPPDPSPHNTLASHGPFEMLVRQLLG
jgi:hypothetical protein